MIYYLISLIVFVLDLLSKWLVVSHINYMESISICPFFNIFFVMNTGISFSFFKADSVSGVWGLITVALIICVALIYLIQHEESKFSKTALAMILGGALGNVWDRIHYNAVVDFLDFHLENHHFPAFNLADSFICIGVALLLFHMYKKEKK